MAGKTVGAWVAVASLILGAFIALPQSPVGAVTISFPNTPIASDRVNGVGWATLMVGDTIYLGGEFTQVRGDNGAVIANRANIVAFDANTGRMRTAFNANTNGLVKALATDGSKLFVGGSFTTVNGMSRGRLAAVDLVTGALYTDWVANASTHVYSLSVGGNRLYVGGAFSSIKSVPRAKVASLSLTNGDVDPAFNPGSDSSIRSLRAMPDGRLVLLGGNFTQVAGTARSFLVALDGSTGAITGPTFAVSDSVEALDFDNTYTRVAAATKGFSNQGMILSLTSGARLMRQQCGGDAQGITVIEDSLITGFHQECDDDETIRLTSNNIRTGARDMAFIPAFDQFWGVRGLDGDYATLAVAGDFTNVGGRPVQGLAIFKSGAAQPPPPPVVAKSMGTGWRYLDNGSNQGTAWRAPGFDDSAWKSGNGQFGYGDGRRGDRGRVRPQLLQQVPHHLLPIDRRRRHVAGVRSHRPHRRRRCDRVRQRNRGRPRQHARRFGDEPHPGVDRPQWLRRERGAHVRSAGVGPPAGNQHDRRRGPPGFPEQLGPELRPRSVAPVQRGPDHDHDHDHDHDDDHHDLDDHHDGADHDDHHHDDAAAAGTGRFPAGLAVALPGERCRPGHHLDRVAVQRCLVERRPGPAGLRRRR